MLRCSICVKYLERPISGMTLSQSIRSLCRGIKLAVRIGKAKFNAPKVQLDKVPADVSRTVEFNEFGDNPGRLRMYAYLPPKVANRPLVVLLHGCGQDAAAFAIDSGWTRLSDRLSIPLILPEQVKANNAGRCFQWFHPSDTTRGNGEAGSIADMTRTAISRFGSDPRRVFVVGLSAGGAMAAALLAAYPDVFAAGASIAGLPVGAARSGMQAMLRMASAGPEQSSEAWAEQVYAAAPAGFAAPWPRLSIWQGQADRTVAPGNGILLAKQWRALHSLTTAPGVEQVHDEVRHQTWSDGKQPLVELWSLPHLLHAYPIGPTVVAPRRFIEPSPIDATVEIARFFGLD